MAEIRKHKQTNSAIVQALEKAMGAAVRPVAPGAPPRHGEDPARSEPRRTNVQATTTLGTSYTAGGWTALSPQRRPTRDGAEASPEPPKDQQRDQQQP